MDKKNYYICIRKVEKDKIAKNEDENAFINYAFWDRKRTYVRLFKGHKRYCYGGKEYDFEVDRIYDSETTFEGTILIKDDSGNIYDADELQGYLEPYDFVIEPQAAKYIENKEAKGDTINIRPLVYLPKLKKVLYSVHCIAKTYKGMISRQVIWTSPAESIEYCYKEIRKDNHNVEIIIKSLKND